MPLLRLTQDIIENQPDHYRVQLSFKHEDGSEQIADVKFEFQFTRADGVDLRWYLEDYPAIPVMS